MGISPGVAATHAGTGLVHDAGIGWSPRYDNGAGACRTGVAPFGPHSGDRLEAALARRLDRITRHLERIERHVGISNEALAVFVRFWLTSTPPLPDIALAAAQTKGRERYEGYVEALRRRLARGRKLADEVSRDFAATAPESESEPR
jgi:hypothetical protein